MNQTHSNRSIAGLIAGLFVTALSALLMVGCQSSSTATSQPAAAPTAAAAPAGPTIRIKAGSDKPYTDPSGNVWLADTGFQGGDTIDRDPNLQIANTNDPGLYRCEHYGMDSFSYPVPNGKYTVKLYFAETFEDITGPGQRVFSYSIGGQTFKDIDLWVKTGGADKAYVETVPVEITNGKLDITFTTNIQSPEINGIEIIPAS